MDDTDRRPYRRRVDDVPGVIIGTVRAEMAAAMTTTRGRLARRGLSASDRFVRCGDWAARQPAPSDFSPLDSAQLVR
jgi:hypothetical protein